jgi:hypothetical protein
LCVSEYVFGGPGLECAGVEGIGPTLRFFRPHTSVLFGRKLFETVE